MCKRQRFQSGRRVKRWDPKCVFYLQLIVCVAIGIPCVLASGPPSPGPNHRHRHGEDHPKLRSRRFGRETQAPSIVALNDQARATDYPTYTYRIEDSNRGQQNLNKPNFTDCANYRPETLEGQTQGTKVIQIQAIDNDPEESGGRVTYSIVSNDQTQDAFAIDPNTGWLTTKKSFDRDEPTREKEIYVTVRATDNGRPQLDAVCTLKVKISDINDNKPMFDKYEYKESIPRDQAVGQTVMRISATDIDDGNNGTILYSLRSHPSNPSDIDYFEIVPQSGEVKLRKQIDELKSRFYLTAVASDRGTDPQKSETPLIVDVVEPNKKPPTFNTHSFQNRIKLKETHKDKTTSILRIEATANSEDGILFFELISGQTEPTNKGKVFTLEQQGNIALLKLEKDLDYEAVAEYTLTIRAWNKYNLAAETFIKVEIEDENDEKPTFQEVYTGSVLENEPPKTLVMRVRAIDLDGTAPNNEVTFHLVGDSQNNFTIDSKTGDITTRIEFDREERDIYQLTVIARDGAPSAFPEAQGQPNERPVTLRIEIADKNDNKPTFVKDQYEAEIDEDSNIGAKVIEVKAIDKDEKASILTYTITEGNVGDVFAIEYPNSGNIVIKHSLDYEEHTEYTLTIRASDSVYDAFTKVKVNVVNINDNPPMFEPMDTNITIQEETVPPDCIFRVKAYDPDIGDRTQPQAISFFIEKGEDHFSVNKEGCVRVVKPLDRDHPHGYPWKQVRVGAKDEWGNTSTSLIGYIDLTVTLLDINDNEPFLNCTNPVKWDENRDPGRIIVLTAEDYDSEVNGPPFTFEIDPAAHPEIKTSFSIRNKDLFALKKFDREQQKQYLVPVVISDSGVPSKTGTSTLTVIIGDENDNDMKPGKSKIFVYKYKQNSTFTIGRVYVEDPDDWDLPDKTFNWENRNQHPQFLLDYDSGNINMKPTTTEGNYTLNFEVQDARFHSKVNAVVLVTVKQIPEEAIIQSGSIRFMGITKEQFIKLDSTGKSKQDRLRAEIAKLFPPIPEENVDVFTVINSPHIHDLSVIDVRFSAHGSPYYKAEKLDGIIGQNKDVLERALQLNIMMIRIDECISEKIHCESSCTNKLMTSEIAYKISTNTSSFVGVNAYVNPECKCSSVLAPDSCIPNPCLNNGICRATIGRPVYTCECSAGFEGPRCEDTSVAFQGVGYAWYKPLSVCNESSLDLQINTRQKNGLILYNGPTYKSAMDITDFVSIELKSGHPILLMDYGSGVTRIELLKSPDLSDGNSHRISLRWSPRKISMQVDTCERKEISCYSSSSPEGTNSFLNINGPLQLGGMSFHPNELKNAMNWDHVPTTEKFWGCISNLTFNGEYYNLGNPSYTLGNVTSCDSPLAVQTARLGVDFNFIIILLVCILILLILVIAIVFYRRRRSYQEVKGDPHDDVRENIINYSDEGGGEGDQTGYDLSVLMKPTTNDPFMHSPTEKIPMNSIPVQSLAPEPGEGPDIQSFLQGNKNKVDNDPDGLPYDDVRNYAYEGDGNSMGSLSSLASGTDDGDLNFDYLPTFGPRFKKLADMYGGQSSDEESYSGAPPEAWC